MPSLTPRVYGTHTSDPRQEALPNESADDTAPLLFRLPPQQDHCTPPRAPQAGIVEVPLRRSWVRPWRFEPSAQVVNRAGRVPLDIDDVAGVTGRLLGDSPLGPVVTCSLLLLGAYFSAASAVGACHLYIDLAARRRDLALRIAAIDAHMASSPANAASMQAWHNVCVRDATIAQRRQWLQVPCMVGGAFMAASILCNPNLLGRYSQNAEALGAALTVVGAPAMIAFTAGTGIESILCARAHSTRGLAQKRATNANGAQPWATAAEQTEARGRHLMRAHAITAGSGFMMAAGLALIYTIGLQFGMRGRQKHTQTGDAASDIARLVHAGTLEATAERIAEVAEAKRTARDFEPNESHATELPTWVQRLRTEDLFEDWAQALGRDAQLRDELGISRRNSVAFDAASISSQTISPALRPAIAAAIASTYAGAGVVRLEQIMRVLTDFYVEQLKLGMQSPV